MQDRMRCQVFSDILAALFPVFWLIDNNSDVKGRSKGQGVNVWNRLCYSNKCRASRAVATRVFVGPFSILIVALHKNIIGLLQRLTVVFVVKAFCSDIIICCRVGIDMSPILGTVRLQSKRSPLVLRLVPHR